MQQQCSKCQKSSADVTVDSFVVADLHQSTSSGAATTYTFRSYENLRSIGSIALCEPCLGDERRFQRSAMVIGPRGALMLTVAVIVMFWGADIIRESGSNSALAVLASAGGAVGGSLIVLVLIVWSFAWVSTFVSTDRDNLLIHWVERQYTKEAASRKGWKRVVMTAARYEELKREN